MLKSRSRLSVLQVGKFYPPYAGGIETHLEDLCTQLHSFADVRIIVANTDRRTVTERVAGMTVHRVGTITNLARAPISLGMVAAIRRSPAHIVHIHWPNPAAVLAYLASGHTGRLVITYHSDIVRQKFAASLFHPILKLVMARCAAVISTSRNYLDTSPVLRQFRERCHVIPYGITAGKLAAPDHEMVESLRREHGPRIVLAVGRLVYYKGFEYLIRAMRSVNARALIVGDGPLRENLKKLAASCGVADRVVFVGEKQGKDLVSYFHAADVFTLPSIARSEAFGIVQLEAMACGKPVVNTQLDSGVPSVSLDGITGLTVPPADSESLASALNRLLDNDDLRRRYGEEGRRRVEREFTLETMMQKTSRVYRQVMESSPLAGEEKLALRPQYYAGLSNILD